VNRVKSEYEKSPASALGPRLVISPTEEQFRTWNRAALEEGQLIEDWAMGSLDKAAEDHFESGSHLKTLDKVAEDVTPYRTNGTSGNA
jgi:hypothetical protein